jgi:uncharacterized membrane protein required for colicin V production
MTNGDIVLLLVLVGAFIVGFVWGTARSLLFLAGGAVVFLIAAHARGPLSSFLARQWTSLSPVYSDMIAMLLLYGLGLGILLLIVWFGARNTGLSARWPDIDRLLGGLVGVCCALLIVAGLAATLALFYGYPADVVLVGDSDWSAVLYRGIVDSQIGGAIHRSLLPAIGSLAAPLLPIGFREAFGA